RRSSLPAGGRPRARAVGGPARRRAGDRPPRSPPAAADLPAAAARRCGLAGHPHRPVVGRRPAGQRRQRAPAARLLADPDGVDAFRFERLVRAAQATGDPGERSRLTADALALWRGTPLAEAAEDEFAVGDVVRLEELRLTAEELRLEALLALGRHDTALPDLDRAVRAWPFRERFAGLHALA